MHKVSIIVPVYNSAKYLNQCVDSILNQTYVDFELILIDDGSVDSSLQICNRYALIDSRVNVYHQVNSGVSIARNLGLSKATGEWVTFIDSDDWVESDYLSNFSLELDDSDLIIQGLEYYDNRSKDYFRTINVNDCTLIQPDIKKEVSENRLLHLGYPVAKAYRRPLIEQELRFCEDISYHEDHIFVLDAFLKAKKIRLVNSVEYKYRYFHSNTTLSTKRHTWENLNLASEMMIARLNTLRKIFLDSGSIYERDVYNFAYSPKISAILISLSKYDAKSMKQILHEIIKPTELATYYRPYNFKDKLIKNILYYAPFIIQLLFFRLYIGCQNRR